MSQLLSIFTNNLVPIFLIAAAGALLRQFLDLEPRTLSQIIFYIFAPCLLFNLLTNAGLGGGEMLSVMGFAVLIMLIVGGLALLAGLALRLERQRLAGMLLATMFANSGNYGMPVVLFAFGETALSYAGLYFAATAIMGYILGAVIASSGLLGWRQALRSIMRLPTLYALLLAVLVISTGWQIPPVLARTVKLLGDASIPSMLLLLGMQLHSASWKDQPLAIGASIGLRLLAGPLLAMLLAPLWGFSPSGRLAAYQAVVIESGMPAAVLNIMVASEYGADPGFVSAVVLVSTILSPLTITPLLYWLGA